MTFRRNPTPKPKPQTEIQRTEPVIPRRQPGRATITVGSKVLFDGEVYAVEEVGEHGLSVRLVAVKP